MEILDDKKIKLDRELSELDNFVISFVNVLEKYTKYVIISGYVAILFGRSRGTEDVDVFIERLSGKKFNELYFDLLNNGYWALNSDSKEELYSMLEDNLAIRFAEKGKVMPNMEVKFVKDALDELSLKEKIKVVTKKGSLCTSKIEMQIAYKKFVLGSSKDLEDARHLQKLFNISDDKINKYKELFEQYGRI